MSEVVQNRTFNKNTIYTSEDFCFVFYVVHATIRRKVHIQTSTSSENTTCLDPQPIAHERQPPDDYNINVGTRFEQNSNSPVATRSGLIVKVPARHKE